jgi:hypothetical protein
MTSRTHFSEAALAKMAGLLILLAAAVTPAFGQTVHHFDFSTIASPRQAYVPFRLIITAKSSTGATVSSYAGTVQLTAAGASGALAVEALSALKFTSGQWVGNLSVNAPGTNVTLQASDPGTGRTGTSASFQVDPAAFRVMDLTVISLASDRTRGLLYASVGPISGPLGTIHVIEPSSGTIIRSYAVAGGVGRIEMSHDAAKLYVVTDDENTVRRLRLPDFVEEVSLNMGQSEPGMLNRADDLAVHPANPNTIAITKSRRELTPRFTGVSVFEGIVEKKTPSVFVSAANAVEWGGQSNRLYGLDNESSPAEFIQYEVTSTNISAVASRQNTLSPFNGQIEFINGRLYCTTGRIIDPETFTIFSELANSDASALMLPLPDRKRVVYLTPGSLGSMLTYDTDTWQLLGSEPFPVPRGQGSGLAFWGNNGVAFHDGRRLFLAGNPWIPSGPAADVEVTAITSQGAPLGAGVEQQMQATVRNLGPNDAGAVLIKITGPADAALVRGSVVGLAAETKITSRELTLRLPSLAAGASVEVQFSASSNVEAWEPFSILAAGAGIDPNSSNNAALIVLKAAPALGPTSPVLFKFANTASASDRTRGTVLVASSSALAPWGNTIVTINPTNGQIGQPVLVGPRPSKLATSDDGKYLYVGFQGTPEVRRFLLPGLTPDLTIALGADGWSGPRFAGQMDVRPGHSTDLLVSRSTGSSDRFGFFRNGVEVLPDRASPETVRFAGPDRILVHENSWGIFRFDLSDAGLTFVTIFRNAEEFSSNPFVYNDGKLYFSDGLVFDAETGAQLGGLFALGATTTPPIIDSMSERALFLQRRSTNHIVVASDMKNLTAAGSNSVAIAPVALGTPNAFTRWGGDGLAFSGSAAVVLMQTDLISGGPPDFRIESVTLIGATLTMRFSSLSPGQYIIEQCSDLGGNWSQLGSVFTETTSEVSVPAMDARRFYRLVKMP